jgi:predicted phosphodiesterase
VRVAALYDVHGNLPALEAVLAEIERDAPDAVLVGGDVSAGPFPAESFELLRTLGDRAVWVRGNADRKLEDWCAEQLSDEQLAFLRGLPETAVIDVDSLGPVLFCHGSPRSDEEILTARSPESRFEEALAGVAQQVVVHGHTHAQYERVVGRYGSPRREYDLAAAADRIRGSTWPQAAEFAEENVLTVPSADEAIEWLLSRDAGRGA